MVFVRPYWQLIRQENIDIGQDMASFHIGNVTDGMYFWMLRHLDKARNGEIISSGKIVVAK